MCSIIYNNPVNCDPPAFDKKTENVTVISEHVPNRQARIENGRVHVSFYREAEYRIKRQHHHVSQKRYILGAQTRYRYVKRYATNFKKASIVVVHKTT